jgi:hypothetical protein
MRILNFKMPKVNSLKPPQKARSDENMRDALGQNVNHVGYRSARQDRKNKIFTCQICEN